MAKIDINGYKCEVSYIDEYARGPDGTCAFCKGDPCNERSKKTSVIAKWWAEHKSWADTCPCCQGRPT